MCGAQRARFGELAEAAAKLPRARPQVALKPRSALDGHRQAAQAPRLAGQGPGPRQFGMDVQFPGLHTALVARSPYFGGTVKRFDGARR